MTNTKWRPIDLEAPERISADVEFLKAFRNSKTRLIEAASAIHGLTAEVVCGDNQTRKIAHKRFRIYYLFRQLGYSYPHIGILFNKDHTTALHGVRRVEASLASLTQGEGE